MEQNTPKHEGSNRYVLEILDGRLAIARLDPTGAVPPWATSVAFVSITRTDVELSIVCAEESVPNDVVAERGFACLRVRGPLPFDAVGVLASIVGPLADAGVSIFSMSTYDTDYVLLRTADLEAATHALTNAGHRIT